MKLGLETESYHLFFQQGVMDIFSFISKTSELGLDGVQINIIPDVGLHPVFGVLSSDSSEYLAKVRKTIEAYGLYCEIDTRFTSHESVTKAVEIASALGADVIRTYMFRRGEYNPQRYPEIIAQLKAQVPLLSKKRIRLAIENHEDETADEIINIVKSVDSEWVGAHCDIGNGMMAWEEPVDTVRKLAPYAYSTHFKDHIVTRNGEELVVCGVPVGEGSIDIDTCFKTLVDESSLTRINIETCFPYASRFSRPKGTTNTLKGTFTVKPAPFDELKIKPLEYYYPAKISEAVLQELMEAQERCVQVSVQALKILRKKYC
ncbi:sugar phosphate isomerase/epimerase [Salmonella enterica subsp. enterica]|uniref:TIM barrel protein n=1 Tax=Salmonella enterica TaxID=28901 RepID=A0A633DLV0_SALER|nr:sugar phosphate isomerase/epimerase [Salmonella enterica]EBU8701277.1 sugar phosphate isomerase/epimerase [Salmonella enterica subsp. enterica serovar Kokomlemle]EBW2603273.1 sugar phosphate isomerase/epimerase [Salmonella enterica subsp. enterica serovar Poano]EBA1655575.1 sugar phosphate isomerase/epimerase [Salmonella enterica]EBE9328091.1 sugar phosphate isomerase/epimerase [Salmonella enterica]